MSRLKPIPPPVTTALIILAVALFLLRDALFFGQAYFERDLTWLFPPQIEAVVRAVAQGSLPLRDPSIGFGQPILASPDTQVFYPPAWLYLIFPTDRAHALNTLLHFLLGGLGAAALCRRWGGTSIFPSLGGVFWILSGPFQSALNLWHHFAGAAWIPWVLVCLDRVLESPSRRKTVVLGVAFGLQILAGSADMCAATLLLSLLQLVCDRVVDRSSSTPLVQLSAALAIALFLGAATWLPALQVLSGSARGEFSEAQRAEWSVHPAAALETAVPLQLGSLPLDAASRNVLFGGRPPFLKTLFLGPLILPLFLALAVDARVSRARRLFLVLGATFSVLIGLGRHAPFLEIATTVLPPLSILRFPVKAMLPASLLLCTGAAMGAAALSQPRPRRFACVSALVLGLVGGGIAAWSDSVIGTRIAWGSDGTETVASVTVALVVTSLTLLVFSIASAAGHQRSLVTAILLGLLATGWTNRSVNFTVDARAMRYVPPIAALLPEPQPWRLYTFPYLQSTARLPDLFSADLDAAAFVRITRDALMAPVGGIWGIEYAWDYDQKGLLDGSLSRLTRSVPIFEARNSPAFLRLLQLANVTRVLDFEGSLARHGLTPQATVPVPGFRPLYLYRVPNPLPRAYAVGRARELPAEIAEAAILRPDFDIRSEVIVDAVDSFVPPPSFEGQVTIVEKRTDRFVLDATLSGPGYVVLLEGYLPGWSATIDGAPVPVRRANAVFTAVETPPGNHRVVFSYRPRSAVVGSSATALSLLAALVAMLGRAIDGLRRPREREVSV